ncbi:hypothetical protein Asp14428_36990 [Actinoplanes sp. NBRC 14428]|nr:hypothetical protein Asp14428_36990 [Actinoplanes sp. NBRC 14428]
MAVPDVLVAETTEGLAVLDGTRVRPLGRLAAASPDGRFRYAVEADTLVGPAAAVPLEAGWAPQVVSPDGTACVLRRGGSLLVARGGGQRRYDAPETVQPDAFTADNTGLFVLEWLPPEDPERYRVRLMDLATGALRPLLTRAKVPVPAGAEEEMRGQGRQAVLSPDRQVLYTLYTHQPGHRHTRDLVAGRRGNVHAFVHVLHLEQRWAYCLDLPHPFGEGPAESHAIAVDPTGGRLGVVDVSSGSLAYASTANLTVERVESVPNTQGTAALALAAGGRTYAGSGTTVTVLDGGAVTRWTTASQVRGLALNRDGSLLYLGGPDGVTWLGTASGEQRDRVRVPGLTVLRHVVPRD